jgi:hypothetical protein
MREFIKPRPTLSTRCTPNLAGIDKEDALAPPLASII